VVDAPADAGEPVDAGASPVDAGQPPPDAGTPDAGHTEPIDAGESAQDAGSPPPPAPPKMTPATGGFGCSETAGFPALWCALLLLLKERTHARRHRR
jgi:hypothetical protein